MTTFIEAVKALKPTGIIGVSTIAKSFNKEVGALALWGSRAELRSVQVTLWGLCCYDWDCELLRWGERRMVRAFP